MKVNGKTLTIKQTKWFRQVIRTGEPTQAAFDVYNCKDRKVAKVIAYENLTKLHLSMNDLMDRMGLDIERDMQDLIAEREAMTTKFATHEGQITDQAEVIDWQTRHKALELTLKLKGRLSKDSDSNQGIGASTKIVIIYPPGYEKKEPSVNASNTQTIPSRI